MPTRGYGSHIGEIPVDVYKVRQIERRKQAKLIMKREAADLPTEMAKSAIVQNALRNRARAQLVLNDIFDKADRGEQMEEKELKLAMTVFGEVQAATKDLLDRWPRANDGTDAKIPASVLDWIATVDLGPGH